MSDGDTNERSLEEKGKELFLKSKVLKSEGVADVIGTLTPSYDLDAYVATLETELDDARVHMLELESSLAERDEIITKYQTIVGQQGSTPAHMTALQECVALENQCLNFKTRLLQGELTSRSNSSPHSETSDDIKEKLVLSELTCTSLKTEIVQLQQELSVYEEKAESAEAVQAELEARLHEAQESVRSSESARQSSALETNERVHTLESQLASMQDVHEVNAQLQQQLDTFHQKQIDSTEALKQDNTELEEQLKERGEKILQLEADLAASSENIVSLRATVLEEQARTVTQEIQEASLSEESKDVENCNSELQKRMVDIEAELERRTREFDDLQSVNTELQQVIDTTKGELQAANEEPTALRLKIKELEEQVNQTECATPLCEPRKEGWGDDNWGSEGESPVLEPAQPTTTANTKEATQSEGAPNAGFEQRISELEEQLKERSEKVSQLEADLASSSEKVTSFEKTLEETQKSNTQLQEQVTTVTEELQLARESASSKEEPKQEEGGWGDDGWGSDGKSPALEPVAPSAALEQRVSELEEQLKERGEKVSKLEADLASSSEKVVSFEATSASLEELQKSNTQLQEQVATVTKELQLAQETTPVKEEPKQEEGGWGDDGWGSDGKSPALEPAAPSAELEQRVSELEEELKMKQAACDDAATTISGLESKTAELYHLQELNSELLKQITMHEEHLKERGEKVSQLEADLASSSEKVVSFEATSASLEELQKSNTQLQEQVATVTKELQLAQETTPVKEEPKQEEGGWGDDGWGSDGKSPALEPAAPSAELEQRVSELEEELKMKQAACDDAATTISGLESKTAELYHLQELNSELLKQITMHEEHLKERGEKVSQLEADLASSSEKVVSFEATSASLEELQNVNSKLEEHLETVTKELQLAKETTPAKEEPKQEEGWGDDGWGSEEKSPPLEPSAVGQNAELEVMVSKLQADLSAKVASLESITASLEEVEQAKVQLEEEVTAMTQELQFVQPMKQKIAELEELNDKQAELLEQRNGETATPKQEAEDSAERQEGWGDNWGSEGESPALEPAQPATTDPEQLSKPHDEERSTLDPAAPSAELEQRISELEEQLKERGEKVSQLEADLASSSEKVASFEATSASLEELQKSNTQLQEQVATVTKELQLAQETTPVKEEPKQEEGGWGDDGWGSDGKSPALEPGTPSAALEQRVSELEEQLKEELKMKQAACEELSNLETLNSEMQLQIKELREQASEKTNKSEIFLRCESIEEELKATTGKLEASGILVTELRQKIDEKQKEVKKAEENLREALQEKRDSNAAAETTAQRYEASLHENNEMRREFEASISSLERKLEMAAEKLTAVESEKQTTVAERDAAVAALASCKEDILSNEVERTKQADLEAKLQAMEEAAKSNKEAIANSETELGKVATYKKQISSLEALCEKLKVGGRKIKEERDQEREKTASLSSTANDLQRKLRSMEAEKENALEASCAAQGEQSKLQEEFAAMDLQMKGELAVLTAAAAKQNELSAEMKLRLEKSEDRLQELQNEKNQLTEALTHQQESYEKLKEAGKKMRQMKETTKEKLDVTAQQLQESNAKVAALTQQLDTSQMTRTEVMRLEGVVKEEASKAHEMQLALDQAHARCLGLEAKVTEAEALTEQIETMSQKATASEKERQDLEETMSKLKQSYEQIKNAGKRMKEMRDALKDQLSDKEKELAAAASRTEVLESSSEELKGLRTQVQDAKSELQVAQNTISIIQGTVEHLEATVQSTQSSLKNEQDTNSTLQQQLTSLAQELQTAKEASQESRVSQLEADLASSSESLKKEQQANSVLEDKLAVLAQELQATKETVRTEEELLESEHQQITNLEEHLKVQQSECESAAEKLYQLAELSNRNSVVEQELNDMKANSEEVRKTNVQLEEQVATLTKELQIAKEAPPPNKPKQGGWGDDGWGSDGKSPVLEPATPSAGFEQRISELEEQLRERSEKVSQLEADLASSSEKVTSFEKTLEETQKSNTQLQEQVTTVTEELQLARESASSKEEPKQEEGGWGDDGWGSDGKSPALEPVAPSAALEQRVSELEEQLKERGEKVSKLEADLASSSEKVVSFEATSASLEELQKSNTQLQEQVATVTKELQLAQETTPVKEEPKQEEGGWGDDGWGSDGKSPALEPAAPSAELEQRVSELEEELKMKQAACDDAATTISGLESKTAELYHLQELNSELLKQITMHEEHLKERGEKVSQLEADLASSSEKVVSFEATSASLEELQKSNTQLQEQVTTVTKELQLAQETTPVKEEPKQEEGGWGDDGWGSDGKSPALEPVAPSAELEQRVSELEEQLKERSEKVSQLEADLASSSEKVVNFEATSASLEELQKSNTQLTKELQLAQETTPAKEEPKQEEGGWGDDGWGSDGKSPALEPVAPSAALEQRVSELEEQLKERGEKVSQLEADLASSSEKVVSFEATSASLEELQNVNSKLEEHLETVTKELQLAKETTPAKEEPKQEEGWGDDGWGSEGKSPVLEPTSAEQELAAKVESLTKELKMMTKKVTTSEGRIEMLKNAGKKIKTERDSLRAQLEEVPVQNDSSNARLVEELAVLREENKKLQTTHEPNDWNDSWGSPTSPAKDKDFEQAWNKEREMLTAALASLGTDMEEKNEIIAKLKEAKTMLESDHTSATSRLQTCEHELQEVKAKVKFLESGKEGAEREAVQMRERCHELEEHSKAMQDTDRKQALQTRIESLKAALSSAEQVVRETKDSERQIHERLNATLERNNDTALSGLRGELDMAAIALTEKEEEVLALREALKKKSELHEAQARVAQGTSESANSTTDVISEFAVTADTTTTQTDMSNGKDTNGSMLSYEALLASHVQVKQECTFLREKLQQASAGAEQLEDAVDAKNELTNINKILEQKLAVASKKCDELDMITADYDDVRADLTAETARADALSKEIERLQTLINKLEKKHEEESVTEFEIQVFQQIKKKKKATPQSANSSPHPVCSKRPSITTSEFYIGDTDDEDERLAQKLKHCEEEKARALAELANMKERATSMSKQVDELVWQKVHNHYAPQELLKDHAEELQEDLQDVQSKFEKSQKQVAKLQEQIQQQTAPTHTNGHEKQDTPSTESESSLGSELDSTNLEAEVDLLKSAFADAKIFTEVAEADLAEHLEEAKSRVQALEDELTDVISQSATPRKKTTEAWLQDALPPYDDETETETSDGSSDVHHLELLDAEIAKMKNHIKTVVQKDRDFETATDELIEQHHHRMYATETPDTVDVVEVETHVLRHEMITIREANKQLTEELVALNTSKDEANKWRDMYRQQTLQFNELEERLSGDASHAARLVELEKQLSIAKMDTQTATNLAKEESSARITSLAQVQDMKAEMAEALAAKDIETEKLNVLLEEASYHKSEVNKTLILLNEATKRNEELIAKNTDLLNTVEELKATGTAVDTTPLHDMQDDSTKTIKEKCRHLQESLKKAHEQCTVQSAKYTEVQKHLNEQISNLQSKCATLENTVNDLTSTKIASETELDLTREELQTATLNLKMLTENHASLQTSLRKSEGNLQQATGSLSEATVRAQGSEKVVKELQENLSEMKTQQRMKEAEIQRLNDTIGRQAVHEDRVKEQLETIKDTLSVKQSNLETEAGEAHGLKIKNIELEGRIGVLMTELENNKHYLEESNAKIGHLEEALAAAQNELTNYKVQVEVGNAALNSEASASHAAAQERIRAIEEELKVTNEYLEERDELIEEDKRTKEIQLEKIADLVRENGVATAKIFELEGLLKIEQITNKSVGCDNVAFFETQKELEALREEMSSVRADHLAAMEKSNEMKENWGISENMLASEKQKLREAEHKLDATLARLQNSSTSESTVKAELEAVRKDLYSSAFGQSEAASAASNVKREYESKLSEAVNESVSLRKKLATVEGEYHALQSECRRLEDCTAGKDTDYSTAIRQRDNAISEVKSRLTKVQDSHMEDAHTIAKLRAELEVSEKLRRDADDSFRSKTQDVDNKLRVAEEYNRKAESLQRKIDSSYVEVESLNAKLKVTTAELTDANNKVWEIEQQKSDAERQLRKVQTDLILAERKVQESTGSSEALAHQNSKLRMELEAVDEQVKEAQRRNKKLTDEMHLRSRRDPKGQAPSEITSLQSRVKFLEGEIELSRSGKIVDTSQTDSKAWPSEKLLLQADIDCLKRKCLMLEDRSQSLTNDLRQADEAVGDAEDRCREAEEELMVLKQNATLESFRRMDSDSDSSVPSVKHILKNESPVNTAWLELLSVEVARMDDLSSTASTSSTHQLAQCAKLKTMLSSFEGRLIKTLQSGQLPDVVTSALRKVQDEARTIAKLIRFAEDTAKKVQERLAADIKPYSTSFMHHMNSLRTAPSPWTDPIAKAIIQQHRGKWCGAAEALSDMLGHDAQDIDKIQHNLKLWESISLDDHAAVSANTLAGTVDVYAPREDTWPLLTAEDNENSEKENVRLRDELRSAQSAVQTLESQFNRERERESRERDRESKERERSVQSVHVSLDEDPFFKTCVLHVHNLDARYRLLLDVRGNLMSALVPCRLPDVSGSPLVRFKKGAMCVVFAISLRRLSRRRKEETAFVEASPVKAARSLLARPAREGKVAHVVSNDIASRTLLEGLQRLRETVTTSKARVDFIEGSLEREDPISETETGDSGDESFDINDALEEDSWGAMDS